MLPRKRKFELLNNSYFIRRWRISPVLVIREYGDVFEYSSWVSTLTHNSRILCMPYIGRSMSGCSFWNLWTISISVSGKFTGMVLGSWTFHDSPSLISLSIKRYWVTGMLPRAVNQVCTVRTETRHCSASHRRVLPWARSHSLILSFFGSHSSVLEGGFRSESETRPGMMWSGSAFGIGRYFTNAHLCVKSLRPDAYLLRQLIGFAVLAL